MNYEATECIMKTIVESAWNFMNTKQQSGEHINDYLTRFKAAKDVLWSHIGKDFTNLLQSDSEYASASIDEKEMKELKSRVVEALLTHMFLSNADRSKCASLLAKFKTEHSLEEASDSDKKQMYPVKLETAVTVLSGHTWDEAWNKNKNKKKNDKGNDSKGKKDEELKLSFAQIKKNQCYCCGEMNHPFKDCPKKLIAPKKDWFINKNKAVQQYNQIVQEISTGHQYPHKRITTASKCCKHCLCSNASSYTNTKHS